MHDDDWADVALQAPDADARGAAVAGDWNGWAPEPMARDPDGVWRWHGRLLTGEYHYKLAAPDGQLHADPQCPHTEPVHGNSVLFVNCEPGPPPEPCASPFPDAQPVHVDPPPDLAAQGFRARPVFVLLPPAYDQDAARRFPVLYAHDGQNLGAWALADKARSAWARGVAEECIIVAVPHGGRNRMREMAPAAFGAAAHTSPMLRFVAEAVKPAVDARYRTLAVPQHTAVLGSSLAGLQAFVAGLARPDVFGNAACLSPSFWYRDVAGSTAYDLARASPPSLRLYMDSGDGPGDNCWEVREMAKLVSASGDPESGRAPNLRYWIDRCADRWPDGATHCEEVWRDRVDHALAFVFPRLLVLGGGLGSGVGGGLGSGVGRGGGEGVALTADGESLFDVPPGVLEPPPTAQRVVRVPGWRPSQDPVAFRPSEDEEEVLVWVSGVAAAGEGLDGAEEEKA